MSRKKLSNKTLYIGSLACLVSARLFLGLGQSQHNPQGSPVFTALAGILLLAIMGMGFRMLLNMINDAPGPAEFAQQEPEQPAPKEAIPRLIFATALLPFMVFLGWGLAAPPGTLKTVTIGIGVLGVVVLIAVAARQVIRDSRKTDDDPA